MKEHTWEKALLQVREKPGVLSHMSHHLLGLAGGVGIREGCDGDRVDGVGVNALLHCQIQASKEAVQMRLGHRCHPRHPLADLEGRPCSHKM